MRLSRLVVGVFALLPMASAASERSPEQFAWEVGLSPVYSYLVVDDQGRPKGGGGVAHLLYQVSDAVGLRAGASWSSHSVDGANQRPSGILHVFSLNGGLTYSLDLLRVVPRIELAAGLLHRRLPGGASATDVGIVAGLGLDYALKPRLSVGGAIHYHGFITNPTNLPVYVAIGPRVALRW